MHIVIIDDHGLFRAGLAQLLLSLNPSLSVTCCADLPEFDTSVNQSAVDLVLLDYHLPGYRAQDAIHFVRNRLPKAKIVLVSAETDPHKILLSIDEGACGFIPKSSDPELLSAALALVVAGGVYLPGHLVSHYQSIATQSKSENRLADLSARQRDVLALVVDGLSNQTVAEALNISPETVKVHLGKIYKTLGVNSRTQATLYCHQHKLNL